MNGQRKQFRRAGSEQHGQKKSQTEGSKERLIIKTDRQMRWYDRMMTCLHHEQNITEEK